VRREPKVNLFALTAFVLLLAAFLLLLIGFRMHVFDAWLFGRFPVLFPALLGLVGGAWAIKLAFNPPPEYEGRGILRWLWIALALVAGTVMLLRVMRNA
jgi:hypothetical protein